MGLGGAGRLGGGLVGDVPNRPDIDANLASIRRGLRAAAEAGVRLLVTPETSLTGLFATGGVTRRPAPVAEAEAKLRRFLRGLRGAPYLVVGLPVWVRSPGSPRGGTRYNVSRLYDPDGHVVADGAKVHSCEPAFPNVGEPGECLLDARIRVHDAFGCWPVRSFRASEQAAAYVQLYRCLGGRNV